MKHYCDGTGFFQDVRTPIPQAQMDTDVFEYEHNMDFFPPGEFKRIVELGLNHNPDAKHRRPGKKVLGSLEKTKPKKSSFFLYKGKFDQRAREKDRCSEGTFLG